MKRLVPHLALLAGALLVSAVAAEVALRVLYGSPVHFRYPQPRYVADPAIGHWMEPDQRSFNHSEPLSVNSVGIRGPDYPRRAPTGTLRVLAIGDSQTFGNGLPRGDTWPALLEAELRGTSRGPRWEVLNGGLSGTDTWQHERMLERLARSYAFDAVVLGFYPNDVTAIYRLGFPEQRTNTLLKRVGYVFKRSALATIISRSYRRLFTARWHKDREQRILAGEPDPSVELGWKQVETSLAAIKARVEQLGVRLLVLVIPRRDQVAAPVPPIAYNTRIADVASRLGIPVVDPLAALREAHATHGDELFIAWDGHNARAANVVLARELAPQLRKLKKPASPTEGN